MMVSMYRRGYRRNNKLVKKVKEFLGRLNWGKLIFGSVVGMVVLVIVSVGIYSRDLPDPSQVYRKSGFSSVVLDRTGEEILFDLYEDENRKFTPLEEVPEYLR